jgi:hypothetical protein
MIGFDGRHQWRRHKLFKLHAKPLQRGNSLYYNKLQAMPELLTGGASPPKFAIRSFLVRRTKNEQAWHGNFQTSSVAAVMAFGADPPARLPAEF